MIDVDPSLSSDRRAERISLALGLVFVAAIVSTILVVWASDPLLARGLATQVATHAVVGRETGIPTGIAVGNPGILVAVLATAQDMAVLFVGYPLVMMAARGSLKFPFLSRLAHRPHPGRERFAARTQLVGILVLAGGLWIPFLPSGALFAALVARAAGYHARLFLPIIGVSGALATIVYSAVMVQLGRAVGPLPLVGVALAMVLLVGGIVWWRERRRTRPHR